MKKNLILVFVLLLAASISTFAGKISYSIDPSTASPQPATVVKNSEGETVIFFNVSSLEGGETFTFTLDMKALGSNITFPVNADMKVKGNKKDADVTFDPAQVIFNDTENSVSTVVTVGLPNGNYEKTKKIKVKIKADTENGKGLGNGAGVKVVIAKTSSMQEFLQIVQEELEESLTSKATTK
jgi:hypothetical protein